MEKVSSDAFAAFLIERQKAKDGYIMGATGILILYAVVSIVRNFIEPKIIGKQIGINPLFTLVSMYVGLKTAGIAGMLLFPVVLIVLFSFYRNKVY